MITKCKVNVTKCKSKCFKMYDDIFYINVKWGFYKCYILMVKVNSCNIKCHLLKKENVKKCCYKCRTL